MARLPVPGADHNTWGIILNDFLGVEHNDNGTLKAGGTLATKANDDAVVHIAGSETVTGAKNFTGGAQKSGKNIIAADELVVNVRDYGAIGDGTTNDTAAINAAIAAAIALKRPLYLPPATYLVTTALNTISSPLTITGYGASISQTTNGVGVFVITGSDVQISGLRITGPDGTVSHGSLPKAISIAGSSAAAMASRIQITECHISGFNGYGVYALWTDQMTVRDCIIREIWHGGILMSSCSRCIISNNDISEINDTVNAYGVIATREELGTSLSSHPRSTDITIANNRISSIPSWEGIDTHAGKRINVIGNTITGCRTGILIGSCDDATNTLSTYAPLECTVANNIIDSLLTNGTAGPGIVFIGASDSDERATGAIVGNVIRDHGDQANSNQGGIYAHTTEALVVTGNTLVNPSPIGITFYHHNRGFTASGNTVVDVWTNDGSLATCISAISTNNTGTVSGNTFDRGPLSGKSIIGGEGLRVTNGSGNAVAVGPNYSAMTVHIVDTGRLSYALLGRARAVSNTGVPEGTVSAPAGAIYTNLNGGAGTTLYYKESGASNTGWRQVAGAIDASAALDFPSIAAGATAELTVTATGATAGDVVHLGPPAALEAGLMAVGRVSATNTVTVRLHNTTAAPIDPVSATWRVRVSK